MLYDDENSSKKARDYLVECENGKETFINIIIEELTGGEEGVTHITRGRFDAVIIPAFCRPSNLRLFMMHKIQN